MMRKRALEHALEHAVVVSWITTGVKNVIIPAITRDLLRIDLAIDFRYGGYFQQNTNCFVTGALTSIFRNLVFPMCA